MLGVNRRGGGLRPSNQNATLGRTPPDEQPPGGFSFGTSWYGGPTYTDKFASRRAPSPYKLIENYQSLIYALVARKRDAVAKIPLRLYMDGSRAQGGAPRSACDPIRVSRHVGERLARSGLVSGGAVDQIYEVRNHPFLTTLDKPDPWGYFTRKKLIGLMCAYQDVVGSAFLVPEGNGWDWRAPNPSRKKGPPDHLWVLYPQYVIPTRYGGSPLINQWQYFRDYLPFESTIWFRQSISLRDAYGSAFSPTYAGDLYADQESKFIAIYDQVLGLGPRPSMIASAKDPTQPPNDAERKRLEQDMVRRHAAGNAGGMLVNNGAWDFTPVSYSPADLAGKEIAEYDRNTLAAIFGVPPTFFTTETNLANLEAADEQFARFAVEPMCSSIAETLTQIVRQWDPRLHFAFDPVVAEDELQRAQIDKIYVDMGAQTINQLNEEKKYPKVPWGEEPLFPSTMVTWTMLQDNHQMRMTQQATAIESGATQDELAVDGHEHQKELDKAKLDQDAKQREERLLGELETLIRSAAAELEAMKQAG